MKNAIFTIAAISAMSLAGCTVYTHRPVARVHVEDEPATVTYEETAPEPAPIVEVEPARPYLQRRVGARTLGTSASSLGLDSRILALIEGCYPASANPLSLASDGFAFICRSSLA